MTMDAPMSRPRLHHVKSSVAANRTASTTPATTLRIRRKLSVIVEKNETWTMSSAVRGASSGRYVGRIQSATR
jgi:hypothetical protein